MMAHLQKFYQQSIFLEQEVQIPTLRYLPIVLPGVLLMQLGNKLTKINQTFERLPTTDTSPIVVIFTVLALEVDVNSHFTARCVSFILV